MNDEREMMSGEPLGRGSGIRDLGSGPRSSPPDPRHPIRDPFPFHPLLLALSPILFLFTHNAAKLPLSPKELVLPIGLSLVGTLLLGWALTLLLRNRMKAAIITSAFVLFFFLYGRVLSALHVRLGEPEFSMPFWGLLLAAVAWGTIRTTRNLRGLTAILNVISATIVLTNVVFGLPALISSSGHWSAVSGQRSPVNDSLSSTYPDIYYIILDMHARSDVLKQLYGVDNKQFDDFLTARGFRVVRSSRTNYAHTYPSLASSLNFEYLDSLGRLYGGKTYDEAPVLNMIQRNRLMNILQQHGYSTLFFSSGDAGIALARQGKLMVPRWYASEFQSLLLSTTPLPVLLDLIIHKSLYDQRRDMVLYALRDLPRAARTRHPVFVFAHILCPHPPFVFGPNGEHLNPHGVQVFSANDGLQVINNQDEYVKGYAGQIVFLDRQVEETVDRILADSPSSPVIILQGDHGPESKMDWGNPQPDALTERFAILNAIRIPDTTALNDSITPVNTFRVVLNQLFRAELPLLPDRSYFSTATSAYLFYDLGQSATWLRPTARDRRNWRTKTLVEGKRAPGKVRSKN